MVTVQSLTNVLFRSHGLLKASIFPFVAFIASCRNTKRIGFVSDPNLSNIRSKDRLRAVEDGKAEIQVNLVCCSRHLAGSCSNPGI